MCISQDCLKQKFKLYCLSALSVIQFPCNTATIISFSTITGLGLRKAVCITDCKFKSAGKESNFADLEN